MKQSPFAIFLQSLPVRCQCFFILFFHLIFLAFVTLFILFPICPYFRFHYFPSLTAAIFYVDENSHAKKTLIIHLKMMNFSADLWNVPSIESKMQTIDMDKNIRFQAFSSKFRAHWFTVRSAVHRMLYNARSQAKVSDITGHDSHNVLRYIDYDH